MLTTGKAVGGLHLTNGPLSHILHNRHYLGEINHHGRSWSGEHPAIIDPETFETVQARLEEQRVARAVRLKSTALLRGKLFNEAGERLTPAYAVKDGVRYGYYVSTSAMQSRDRGASLIHRLPAASLETAIVNALRSALEEGGPQGSGIGASKNAGPVGCPIIAMAQPQASQFRSDASQCQALIDAHLVRVAVLRDRLEVDYRADPKDRSETETLSIPWIKPTSRVRRALLEPIASTALRRPMESDERNRLIRSIASARSWLEELVKGSVGDVAELAARENRTARSIRMTLSLAFLDPALIDAACTGTLPRGYGVTRLMDLPARFADQWRALGLTRPV